MTPRLFFLRGGGLLDRGAGWPGVAGEGQIVDQRMGRKVRRPFLGAIARNDVEHAGWDASLQRQFGDADRSSAKRTFGPALTTSVLPMASAAPRHAGQDLQRVEFQRE